MDKNAIKKFAVWARTELIARVSLKSVEYGITEGNIEEANVWTALVEKSSLPMKRNSVRL